MFATLQFVMVACLFAVMVIQNLPMVLGLLSTAKNFVLGLFKKPSA